MNSIAPLAASLIALLLSCAATLAQAGQIYKCTASDGSVEFSNLACPSDTSVSIFAAGSSFVGASNMHPLIRLDQQRHQDAAAAGDISYTGAAWNGSGDSALAERTRAARAAEAQRRALRLRAGPDRAPG